MKDMEHMSIMKNEAANSSTHIVDNRPTVLPSGEDERT